MKYSSFFRYSILAVLLTVSAVSCDNFKFNTISQSNQSLKIGAILPLTGPAADSADYIKKGIDLAVEEINSQSPKGMTVVYQDSKNQPALGVAAFQQMNLTDQPSAIIVSRSSVTKAIAPLTKDGNTVLIATSVAIPNITNASKFIFRVYPEANGLAGVAANYAKTQCKTAVVIYVNDDFGISSAEVFQKFFEQEGKKVVLKEPYNATDKDFRSQWQKIKLLNPTCAWLVGYGPAYSTIIKQMREVNVDSTLIADQTLGLPTTLQQAGTAAEGVVYVDGPMTSEFVEKYKKRYGNEPTSYAGYAYDIINMLNKVRKENKILPKDLSVGFSLIKDFPGAMGKISILPNRDASLEFILMQVKNGKPTVYKVSK